MTDNKGITWIQVKGISVGQQFKLTENGNTYTRVKPNFPLPSLSDWRKGKGGSSTPSREHVFAVDEISDLTAVHPDNNVIPLGLAAALTFDPTI